MFSTLFASFFYAFAATAIYAIGYRNNNSLLFTDKPQAFISAIMFPN